MENASLDLAELLERANRLRASIPELADTDPFTDRTVYYYAQQGLLPRDSRRRGPGTTYPEDFVDRLLFIRRLQKEQLTLANIRKVVESVPSKTIQDVAHGREPLEIRLGSHVRPEDLSVHSEVVPLASMDYSPRGSSSKVPAQRRSRNFSVSAVAAPSLRSKAGVRNAPTRFSIGHDAELQIHRPLTPLQEKRVQQVVGLLRSILEEDD